MTKTWVRYSGSFDAVHAIDYGQIELLLHARCRVQATMSSTVPVGRNGLLPGFECSEFSSLARYDPDGTAI